MFSLGFFLLVSAIVSGIAVLVFLRRDKIGINPRRMGTFFSPSTIGIIALCFGLLDIVGTLGGLGYRTVNQLTWGMQYHSNNVYGSGTARNDVETDRSKYMYEFANVVEAFGRAQLWQRLQFDIVVICLGSFLVAYHNRKGESL